MRKHDSDVPEVIMKGGSKMPRLNVALQRRDSKKPRLWQLRMQRQGDSKMPRPREGEMV